MRAGFYGAPVVAGGDHHGVHAVHDALVVGSGAIGVGGGEGPGGDNAVAHLFGGIIAEGELIQVDGAARARQAPVGQVGEDAQVHAPAADAFHQGGQALHGCVDRVGAHGVAHVVDQVQHQERPDGGVLDQAHLQVARTAAQALEHRVDAGGLGQQTLFLFQEGQARGRRVGQVEHLHLPDHLGGRGLGREAARRAGQLRHKRRPGHHGRLFDGHGHQHLAPVHQEVLGDAQGQGVHADRVLDHVVGLLGAQPGASAQGRQVLRGEILALGQPGQAFFET